VSKTLLLYFSGYGHTRKIAVRIRIRLEEMGAARARLCSGLYPGLSLFLGSKIPFSASLESGTALLW